MRDCAGGEQNGLYGVAVGGSRSVVVFVFMIWQSSVFLIVGDAGGKSWGCWGTHMHTTRGPSASRAFQSAKARLVLHPVTLTEGLAWAHATTDCPDPECPPLVCTVKEATTSMYGVCGRTHDIDGHCSATWYQLQGLARTVTAGSAHNTLHCTSFAQNCHAMLPDGSPLFTGSRGAFSADGL